jgi:exopolyphosphatase/guanosine-5'-triphosphate,3'-diphosphate pyrophosphatase
MERYAAIDVGSHSVLIHIAEKDEKGELKTLLDSSIITKLGEGLKETGVIKHEAMERTIHVLRDFMDKVREHKVKEVAAIGTMALREAKNSKEFIEKVAKELDLTIQVISGEEEARMSHLAVVAGLGIKDEDIVIFDIGGGSTEFIFSKGYEISKRFSINVGALILTDGFLKSDPVKRQELDSLLAHLDGTFSKMEFPQKVDRAVGMGGTITSMTAVECQLVQYDPDVVQGATLELSSVERQMELYLRKTIEEKRAIGGLQPMTADIILAGAAILYSLMKRLGVGSILVSDRGIRHGLIFDRFGKKAIGGK